ncbi:hypothetical protein [Actinoplanes sp. NPDC051851]|uniref:hypothetical protein n=1 Tax=Actinoplanes sp. NPDC051851 TaxID=3154753 RepID=UPI003421C844
MDRDDASTRTEIDPALDEVPSVVPEEESVIGPVPGRVGCRSDLRGWAGAHLHGAVRPRRRAAGRGRPPGRWC